jgi:DNA-directed RNA polymerase subunit beta'
LILEQGSKEQIRQLTGMWLMAKPKKSTAGGGEIIENQFFLTLKKVFLFLSTLFLLTVLVKVLRIRP